jgi:predicted neutral ceramidase superfamily lipid hydrolase
VILIAYFLVGEGSIYFLNTTVITPVEAPTAANNFAILSLILAVAYFIVLGLVRHNFPRKILG